MFIEDVVTYWNVINADYHIKIFKLFLVYAENPHEILLQICLKILNKMISIECAREKNPQLFLS